MLDPRVAKTTIKSTSAECVSAVSIGDDITISQSCITTPNLTC